MIAASILNIAVVTDGCRARASAIVSVQQRLRDGSTVVLHRHSAGRVGIRCWPERTRRFGQSVQILRGNAGGQTDAWTITRERLRHSLVRNTDRGALGIELGIVLV